MICVPSGNNDAHDPPVVQIETLVFLHETLAEDAKRLFQNFNLTFVSALVVGA